MKKVTPQEGQEACQNTAQFTPVSVRVPWLQAVL
jgi:hypothetical protein